MLGKAIVVRETPELDRPDPAGRNLDELYRFRRLRQGVARSSLRHNETHSPAAFNHVVEERRVAAHRVAAILQHGDRHWQGFAASRLGEYVVGEGSKALF